MVAPYLEVTLISGALVYFCLTFLLRSVIVRGCFSLKKLRKVVNSMNRATMSQYGATNVAAESIIAQINSQCKSRETVRLYSDSCS
jgi:hypothetical protein